MLGVSAELLMKWLIARFIAHVPERKRGEFERTREQLWMKTERLFTTFVNAFEPHYCEIDPELRRQAEGNLQMVETLIRINRDDVGHGRLQRIDHEMVHGYLISYLTLLSIARQLADAFGADACSFYAA